MMSPQGSQFGTPRGSVWPHLQVCVQAGWVGVVELAGRGGLDLESVVGGGPPLTPVTLPGEPGLLVAPVNQQSPFLGYAGGPELARESC